jgi:hypothetical protein
MSQNTQETVRLIGDSPSARLIGSGRGKWTPPSAKFCVWERCSKKRAVINHPIYGPLCWWHRSTAKQYRPNDQAEP